MMLNRLCTNELEISDDSKVYSPGIELTGSEDMESVEVVVTYEGKDTFILQEVEMVLYESIRVRIYHQLPILLTRHPYHPLLKMPYKLHPYKQRLRMLRICP